jgi:hypothetical protein
MSRLAIAIFLSYLTVSLCSAQPGWSTQYIQDGFIHFTNPTYNAVEINENSATLLQWADEVIALLEIDGSFGGSVQTCFNPSCSSFSVYPTAGYNYGSWQVHDCSYGGWTWDNCYSKPTEILIEQAVPTRDDSWGTVKALFR